MCQLGALFELPVALTKDEWWVPNPLTSICMSASAEVTLTLIRGPPCASVPPFVLYFSSHFFCQGHHRDLTERVCEMSKFPEQTHLSGQTCTITTLWMGGFDLASWELVSGFFRLQLYCALWDHKDTKCSRLPISFIPQPTRLAASSPQPCIYYLGDDCLRLSVTGFCLKRVASCQNNMHA